MNETSIAFAAAALLTIASQSAVAGDAEAGKAKSARCIACHGVNGVSAIPMYPNLAGQKEQYLVSALKAYRDGGRDNATMKSLVAALSDADIDDLAAYYSSLE